VDAIDQSAKNFYLKYGFVEFDKAPMKLCLAVETILDIEAE